jgi:alpha-beta hydrolase superfamily lysophospholipase
MSLSIQFQNSRFEPNSTLWVAFRERINKRKAMPMTELPIIRSFRDELDVEIKFYEWPVANPKAVIQIAHGLGEHARRYDQMAALLNRAGFSVYADDHRGHGQTGLMQIANKQTKRLGSLGVGGMDATFKQVAKFSKLIKSENPGKPLVILGHSWGSFIAQKIINKNSDLYDAVVLSGSALTMPGYLATGDFNKVWKKLPGSTGYEWLSREVEVQKKFVDDPLTFLAAAMQVFGISNSLKLFGKPSKKVRSDLPILVQVGEADPIGGEFSNKALVEAYRKNSGSQDIELFVYHDARHEIYNELNKEEIIQDLIDWINLRIR